VPLVSSVRFCLLLIFPPSFLSFFLPSAFPIACLMLSLLICLFFSSVFAVSISFFLSSSVSILFLFFVFVCFVFFFFLFFFFFLLLTSFVSSQMRERGRRNGEKRNTDRRKWLHGSRKEEKSRPGWLVIFLSEIQNNKTERNRSVGSKKKRFERKRSEETLFLLSPLLPTFSPSSPSSPAPFSLFRLCGGLPGNSSVSV